jgi:hypothetical protein
MSSAISFKEHGFWLSNKLCEQVYYYIRERIRVIEPELYTLLPKKDESIISWIVMGMCPDLEDLIKILNSKEILEKALEVEDLALRKVARNEEDILELRKAVKATKLLLEEKITLKLDDENAYLHKFENV